MTTSTEPAPIKTAPTLPDLLFEMTVEVEAILATFKRLRREAGAFGFGTIHVPVTVVSGATGADAVHPCVLGQKGGTPPKQNEATKPTAKPTKARKAKCGNPAGAPTKRSVVVRAIEKAGGTGALARKLRVSPESVRLWRMGKNASKGSAKKVARFVGELVGSVS